MTLEIMTSVPKTPPPFASLHEFYPYYLSQHQHHTCRLMHFLGNTGVLLGLIAILHFQSWWFFFTLPVLGYGFAWLGHFVFEKNKPATLQFPVYSFVCDWILYKNMLTGKIKFM